MLCDFSRVFHPTEQDIERRKKVLVDVHANAEEDRKHIVLVRKANSVLYAAEPFKGFLGDCELCKHYRKSPYNFVDGGTCLLHNIPCSFGFVCKSVVSDYPFDYQIKSNERGGT